MEYDPKTATEEEKEEWWRKRYGDAKYPEPTWNTVGFDTNATLENVFDLPKKEEDYFIEKEHTVEHELHQEHYDEETNNRVSDITEEYDIPNEYASVYNDIDHLNQKLAACTDGVGTKILLAQHAYIKYNRPLNSIGQDVVAMVVNDLICKGAEPLFFLDYFASHNIPNDQYHQILAGIHSACTEIGIPLIGGETAELPGIIRETTLDVAGFGVGKIIKELPTTIETNDVVLGIKASGFHSNGYTIIRRHTQNISEEFTNLLLEPTIIYANKIKGLHKLVNIKGLAHITGGGFDNIKRILNKNQTVLYHDHYLYTEDYPTKPTLYRWIQEREFLTNEQMRTTFNCGIGMVLIVSKEDAFQLEPYEDIVEIGVIDNVNEAGYVQRHAQVSSQ